MAYGFIIQLFVYGFGTLKKIIKLITYIVRDAAGDTEQLWLWLYVVIAQQECSNIKFVYRRVQNLSFCSSLKTNM